MKNLIETINGQEVKREFIIMEDSFHNQFTGQKFYKSKKTQIIVNGSLLVTLSGWNTSNQLELLNTLKRINAYIQ